MGTGTVHWGLTKSLYVHQNGEHCARLMHQIGRDRLILTKLVILYGWCRTVMTCHQFADQHTVMVSAGVPLQSLRSVGPSFGHHVEVTEPLIQILAREEQLSMDSHIVKK